MSLLTEQVKEEAKRLGARIAGIGVLDRWANAPKGHKPPSSYVHCLSSGMFSQ